jgi:nucleotide-binding universal stress UspA family protein
METTGNVHVGHTYQPTMRPSEVTEGRRKVVIALDDSEYSKYALGWSLDTLIQPETDLVYLLSIGIMPEEYMASLTQSQEDRDARLKQRGDEFASRLLESTGKVIQQHQAKTGKQQAKIQHEVYALSSGDPRSIIVDFCRDQKADLLVMGHRGRGMLSK